MLKKKLPYIIAEVGSNHLGNKKLCFDSIIQAKKAGADCIKFQIFDENNLVNKKLKFQYQRFRKVKVTIELVKKLYKFAKKNKIDFSISPFDSSYVPKLKNFVDFFKVASGDINNFDLLKAISKTKKKVVLSTGMSDQSEIEKAIKFFKRGNVAILHCMSSYPTMRKDANLINLEYLKKRHKVITGYSDHVPGVNASINAALLAISILSVRYKNIQIKLQRYRSNFEKKIPKKPF